MAEAKEEEIDMLTLAKLAEMGIDAKEGLTRCMNNEGFYFKMLKMGLSNEYFDTLEKSVEAGDLSESFEAAHALKGVIGNLAIAPIYTPLAEMTELLRAKESADYVALYKPIKETRDKLLALCMEG